MFDQNELTAFNEAVLPHLDAAYNLARWLTRNDHDAEDVVQEASLRAFKYWKGFSGRDCRSWLLAIVRNTSRSWMQQAAKGESVAEFDEDQHSRFCPTAGPEAQMIRQSGIDSVRQCIEELPVEYKETLVMREMEEMSYKEIADATSVPLGTVMSRLARARARVQNCLLVRAKEARA